MTTEISINKTYIHAPYILGCFILRIDVDSIKMHMLKYIQYISQEKERTIILTIYHI